MTDLKVFRIVSMSYPNHSAVVAAVSAEVALQLFEEYCQSYDYSLINHKLYEQLKIRYEPNDYNDKNCRYTEIKGLKAAVSGVHDYWRGS